MTDPSVSDRKSGGSRRFDTCNPGVRTGDYTGTLIHTVCRQTLMAVVL
jgi:hypothetical protein